MNCIIPSGNIKIINKALHTLAKIGDVLYIDARSDYLRFAAINQNKTSYVTFDFHSVFFSSYEVTNIGTTAGTDAPVTCELLVKALLNIFKTRGPKEKSIDWCKIEFENNPNRILVKMKYKHDVIVNHSIKLIDVENICVPYDKNSMPNCINTTGSFFTQVLANFQMSDEDISFEIKNNKTTVRNYDVAANNIEKRIRSQVVLTSTEFILYRIQQECNITMCFKPFRAAVAFAETFTLPIMVNFDTGGKPIIFTIKSPIFEMNFVLSTISPDGYTQTCTASTSLFGTTSKRKNVELSREEKTMVDNLDWDSDFEGDDNGALQKVTETAKRDAKSMNSHRVEEDVVPRSPESPRSKRLKIIFGRCAEITYHESNIDLGEEWAPNSDSE